MFLYYNGGSDYSVCNRNKDEAPGMEASGGMDNINGNYWGGSFNNEARVCMMSG